MDYEAFTIPCASLGFFVLLFGFIALMRYLNYRETLALAEKGLVRGGRLRGNGGNGKDTLRWGIVITAVGMVRTEEGREWVGMTVMITAVIIAVFVMLAFAGVIAGFVERHPTLKILALSFLILIGVMLVAEGLHLHIPKGYVYFGMAFSLVVELLNMRLRKAAKPVKLHQKYVPEGSEA